MTQTLLVLFARDRSPRLLFVLVLELCWRLGTQPPPKVCRA